MARDKENRLPYRKFISRTMWGDMLSDKNYYQRVMHAAKDEFRRTFNRPKFSDVKITPTVLDTYTLLIIEDGERALKAPKRKSETSLPRLGGYRV